MNFRRLEIKTLDNISFYFMEKKIMMSGFNKLLGMPK